MLYEDVLFEMRENSSSNLLILGPAGYGKSYLIRRLHENNKGVLFSAPSGIAALNIQGVTLHSLFNLKPVTPQPPYFDITLSTNKIALLKKSRKLLIDEISMVSADLLDKVDIILKKVRNNSKPFGGMKIIMVGDIFQLQPYIPKTSLGFVKKLYPGKSQFTFFNSNVFQNNDFIETLEIYNLNRDFRHENDIAFRNLLFSIRLGKCSEDELVKINCPVNNDVSDCIHLTTTNAIADFINKRESDKLDDKIDMSYLKKEIYSTTEVLQDDMYPMKDELEIKEGMKIIFVMNDSQNNGRRWVNGTTGIIRRKVYSNNNELESVIVSLEGEENNNEYEVAREWYEIYLPHYNEIEDKIDAIRIASVNQFPFISSWAITIHRSQSLTLEKLILDLGAKVFADGQLYVGLSRVRKLEDITLNRPIGRMDIRILPETLRFYYDFIIPRMKNISFEQDPHEEYREKMRLYNSYSVANNFKGNYELSKSDIEYINDFRNDNNPKNVDVTNTNINKNNLPKSSTDISLNSIPSIVGRKARKAPEGIDKIKVILNPYYLNPENQKRNIHPHNKLTLHLSGPFIMLAIHAEYIYHNSDIHLSIAKALYELINFNIINFDIVRNYDKTKSLYFIYTHLELFIIGISELEFYFNIRRENITINEDAVAFGYLIRIMDNRKKVTTYYTRDYNSGYLRRSCGIIYDKEAKLIKDNQTSHKLLSENPYKLRLELRLYNISTDWLHIDNLKGDYNTVIKRHLEYLVILYKKFFEDYIEVNAAENKYLTKIVEGAKCINRERYTNPDEKLKQQTPIQKEQQSILKTDKHDEKNDALISAFLSQMGTLHDDNKYAIFSSQITDIWN